MNPHGFFSEFARACRLNLAFVWLVALIFCSPLAGEASWFLAFCFGLCLAGGLCSLVSSFLKGSPQHDLRGVQVVVSLVEITTGALGLASRFLLDDTPPTGGAFALACTFFLYGIPAAYALLWCCVFLALRHQ